MAKRKKFVFDMNEYHKLIMKKLKDKPLMPKQSKRMR